MCDTSEDEYKSGSQAAEMEFLSLWRITMTRLTREQSSPREVAELMHRLYEAVNGTTDVCAPRDRRMYRELYKILLKEAQRCDNCMNAVNDSGLGTSITMNSSLDSPLATHNGIRRRPNRQLVKGGQFSLVKGMSVEVAPRADVTGERNTPGRDTSSSSSFSADLKPLLYVVSIGVVVLFLINLIPLPKFVLTISYTKIPPI
uniref:Uncharacterized protein n=1 Tax=Parascaris univalens TaxID=6257 RepID=A0A915AVW2_PARUN